ncbi:SusD/RagB family nutrient-binding outer membrane lipoprotein [Persicitalea sp.]|uniref:SusD/RagB family nutrient-binding outer membrane lipoprotein n=1 Tax=Persicitalea sp. TaxID=3100273 RepID=UPI003592FD1E
MKSGIIKIITVPVLLAVLAVGFYACTDKFDDLNTDKTKLTSLDASGVGNAFAAAQYRSIQASWQTFQSLFADLQSQFYANVAINFPSDRNVMVGGWLNGAFNGFYNSAVPPLLGVLEATAPGGPSENAAIYAIANIWKVQMFLPRTDYWGPIPYSQVGNGGKSVEYDSQEFIYKDFLKLLKEGAASLQAFKGKNILGDNDQVYQGNVDKWILFANTMRLRVSMRMSKVEPALAKTNAEEAVAGGVLTTNAHDAFLKVTTNSLNPMAQTTAWNEYRMSAAMESVLKGYDDPRMSKYYAPVPGTNTFKGLRNGFSQAQLGLAENAAVANSNVNPAFTPDNMFSTPFAIMYASEAWFLRAEGALKGWNMGTGTAKEFYEKGIEASMKQWGITDAAAIQAYTNSTSTPVALDAGHAVKSPPLSDIPVKWATTPEKQLEQIITQKWLSLWPNGHEAWAEYRRTGYPKLYPRINSENPDVPAGGVVRRTPFTQGEFQTNEPGVQTGISKLGGPDSPATRLWWDKP